MILAIIKNNKPINNTWKGLLTPFHSPDLYAQMLLIINDKPSNIGQPITGPISPIMADPCP